MADEIILYRDGSFRRAETALVGERPVSVFYNDDEVVTLLTTGKDLGDLAIGFLVAEGIVSPARPPRTLDVDAANGRVFVTGPEFAESSAAPGRRIVTSACGKGTVFHEALDDLRRRPPKIRSDLRVRPDEALAWMLRLSRGTLQPSAARGMHACLLLLDDGGTVVREDVGRHNALDKVIGRAFLDGLDLSRAMLFTTGRLTSEVVLKVSRLGVPVVLSRSAATDLAVELARLIDLTLIGYVRGGGFHVYVAAGRVAGITDAP